MRNWRKALSGFLAALMLLTTLAAPAAATGIAVTAGQIDDNDTLLPIVLHLSNTGSTVGSDVLEIQVTDTDGLLTGTSVTGSFTFCNNNITVPANTPDQLFTIYVPIQDPITSSEIGQSFDVDVVVYTQATGTGVPGNQCSNGFTSTGLFGGVSYPTTGTITLSVTPTAATPNELQDGLIDDVDMDNSYAPGETVHVEVTLDNANQDYNDVTVEGWLTDASGDRVGDREETKEFNLDANDDKENVEFDFKLPNDVDEGTYTLHLVVTSDEGQLDLDSSNTFDVDREQDSLFYDKISFDNTVNAGDSVDFAVILFNNGLEDEDDVMTQVTVSGVGVSQTSDYFTVEEDDDATRYFTLTLPDTMSTDTYQVTLHTWNKEVDITETRDLFVTALASPVTSQSGVSATADSTVKTMDAVTGGAYILTVSNNNASQATYTIEVAGTEGWASSSVTPAALSLAPGASGQVSVFVSPNEGVSGVEQFSVYVKEGATIVDTIPLTASITAESAVSLGTISTVGSIALVGLVVLAVLLVWRRETPRRRVRSVAAGRKGSKKKDSVYY